jgi:hypothetical protein
MKGLALGEDLYFLGFPYGIVMDFAQLNNGYPLPLCKRACVSALGGTMPNFPDMLLDGHNNPGFSGGPVIYSRSGPTGFMVAGVITAFMAMREPVHAQGTPTPFTYNYNTGIIHAYSIEHAVNMIKANPIGFALPA